MVQAAAQTDQADPLDRGALALRQVVVLSDGVAGHDRSSEGIVLALSRLGPTNAIWVAMREVPTSSRRLARLRAAIGLGGSQPKRFASFEGDLPRSADLVVSTGPATAAANISLARSLKARNIYYGFPKWPPLGVTALLSPLPRLGAILAPRPSVVNAAELPPPRPIGQDGERHIAVLFGGDSKHYQYQTNDMKALGDALKRLIAERPQWRVTVFDSRRTNAETFLPLEYIIAAQPKMDSKRFVDGGLGSNAEAFGADAILVSADSLSMVHEALAAARPVIVVRPKAYRPPRRDRRELRGLVRAGRVVQGTFNTLDAKLIARPTVVDQISRVDELADLLRSRGF